MSKIDKFKCMVDVWWQSFCGFFSYKDRNIFKEGYTILKETVTLPKSQKKPEYVPPPDPETVNDVTQNKEFLDDIHDCLSSPANII